MSTFASGRPSKHTQGWMGGKVMNRLLNRPIAAPDSGPLLGARVIFCILVLVTSLCRGRISYDSHSSCNADC